MLTFSMEFLRGSKSEEHTSSSTGSKLTRLFSRESQDDIPTSLPPDQIHKREHVSLNSIFMIIHFEPRLRRI